MRIEDNQNTQERILQEAQRLFAEKGFWGTSVQEITDAAKINKAMLFYYFKSKENLYCKLIENIFKGIVERIENELNTDMEPVEKLKIILDMYDDFYHNPETFDMFRIIFQDIMGPSGRIHEYLKGYKNRIMELVGSVIEEGIEKGVFRKVDSHMIAIAILGILFVFARHRICLNEEFNIENISQFIHTTILEGIKK